MANVNLSKVYSDLFDFIYAWGDDQYRGTIDGKYYPVSINSNGDVFVDITDSQGNKMSIPESYLNRESFNNLLSDAKTMKATELNNKYITGNYSNSSNTSYVTSGSSSNRTSTSSGNTGSSYSSTSINSGSTSSSYSGSSGSYYGTTADTSVGVTGELSMADATYATSKAGMKELSSILQSEIDRAINYLSSSEYTTMINTISRYWVGVDADKFKKQIQNELTADASLFKSYKSIVQNALNAQLAYHNETQSKIADTIQIQS